VIVAYHVTPASIHTEEGKLLARERAWQDDAEQLLRDAVRAGQPGAALELAFALTDQPGREDEADTILAEAAQTGDKEALYWHARESAEKIGVAAESEIRSSIAAGNVFSNYDLGLVLASDPARRGEAEDAFHIAIGAGYDTARNDLGLLLCEWVGREAEGEEMLADAGRRGQPRCFANLATHLISKGRREDAVAALRAAAEDGYLRAYGRLAYLLEDLGRYADALAAFQQGIDAGESPLETHLTDFRTRHPELTASPT
jgi:tetratricopeptide (TPR) repeat protein